MIKTILLDLDNTLLGNPPDQFVRHYLGLLARHLHDALGLKYSAEHLMTGTRAVVHSTDPLTTNEAVFYGVFTPLLTEQGVSRAEFDPVVAQFYAEVYPQLQALTERRTGARRLVEWLITRDYQVIVATNPFFPRVAIEQRLAWAGVPVDEIGFEMVTTLENTHYSKPHPEFYEEILARVGVQADEAIMVGDDWQNDMMPAWQAGLNTFWIVPDGTNHDSLDGPIVPDGVGTLADFACRVQEENWLETLVPRAIDASQIGPRLSGNLAALLGIVAEVPEWAWTKRPKQAEWSPIEVLCHIGESERDVQRPRLELIATEDNPFLSQPKEPPPPDSRICPKDAVYVAEIFADERLQTIEFLAGLDETAWQRPARHYIFGPTTLLEVANFIAQHDRLHLQQLGHTVALCI